jgi:ribosomal protein S18 acetylase RimI-like enzyme
VSKPSARRVESPPDPALHVRAATPADLDALVQLENASFDSDRLSRRQWLHHLRGSGAEILVASEQERLRGALVLFFRRGSTIARVYSLAIDAAARGRGIGGQLLAAAEQTARDRGCSVLRLEVRRDNTPARRLYEARDFRIIGERSGYYADGEDAVRYERAFLQD